MADIVDNCIELVARPVCLCYNRLRLLIRALVGGTRSSNRDIFPSNDCAVPALVAGCLCGAIAGSPAADRACACRLSIANTPRYSAAGSFVHKIARRDSQFYPDHCRYSSILPNDVTYSASDPARTRDTERHAYLPAHGMHGASGGQLSHDLAGR